MALYNSQLGGKEAHEDDPRLKIPNDVEFFIVKAEYNEETKTFSVPEKYRNFSYSLMEPVVAECAGKIFVDKSFNDPYLIELYGDYYFNSSFRKADGAHYRIHAEGKVNNLLNIKINSDYTISGIYQVDNEKYLLKDGNKVTYQDVIDNGNGVYYTMSSYYNNAGYIDMQLYAGHKYIFFSYYMYKDDLYIKIRFK